MGSVFRTLSVLLLITAPALAQTTWEMPTEYPATAMPGEGVAMFAEQVADLSDGQLVVEPSFDASAGIKSADMIDAVQQGRVQAGDAFGGAMISVDPIFGLSSLPFQVSSLQDAKALMELARPAYEAALEERGQRLLYTTPWPASGIWSKEPIRSLDDLRALSMRTYDDTSTKVMNASGAQATKLSWADAMPKIEAGEIDAVLSSGDGGAGRRLWEFLPHFTEVNYAMPLSFATVNIGAYEALSPELRGVVDEAAAATEDRQWRLMRTRVDENYDRMRSSGVQIQTEVPDGIAAALMEGAGSVVEDWRTDAPEGSSILEAYKTR